MRHKTVIQRWIDSIGHGSLLLPDGWFGRPYDNLHQITSIQESENSLRVVLDMRITLLFEGLKAVEQSERDLIFAGFDRFHFDWNGIGTPGGSKDYYEGQVKIVSVDLR